MVRIILPPALHLVDHRDAATWVPPGYEAIPTTPPDDRMDLARAFVADDCPARSAARVLAQRAALGDREAWAAVVVDMTGPGRGHAWRVAEALGEGDLDTAVAEAARACGETVGEWLAWMRSERASAASAARTPEEASLRARLEAERARADKLAQELASACAERDGALAQCETLTTALRETQRKLDALRAAVLSVRAHVVGGGEGEPLRVHIDESTWKALLSEIVGGGR